MLLGNPGSLPQDVTPDQVRRKQARGLGRRPPSGRDTRPGTAQASGDAKGALAEAPFHLSPLPVLPYLQFIIVGSVAVAFRVALLVSAALCVRDFGSGLQQLFQRGDEQRGSGGANLSAPLLGAVVAVAPGSSSSSNRHDEPFHARATGTGRGKGGDTDCPNPGGRGAVEDGGGGDGYGWGFVPQPQEQSDDADGDGFGYAPKPAQSAF